MPSPSATEWPQDTQACVFLGRAIERIGLTVVSRWTASDEQVNLVHSAIVKGIKAGKLRICARSVDAVTDRLDPVTPETRSSVGWTVAMRNNFQIDVVRRRAWISTADSDCISQPHWLFVTAVSLEEFLTPFTAVAAAKNRAVKHLANILQFDRHLGRDHGWEACREFGVTMAQFKSHIWPRAREEAGLPQKARAGRKKQQGLQQKV